MTLWSPQQDKALQQVDDWIKNGEEQVFRLFGYAGTGKTTMAKALAEGVNGRVMFGAFTGKAAHVLQTKGCKAQTIHSMIYRSRDKSREQLRNLEEELAILKRELHEDGMSQEDIEKHKRVSDMQRLVIQERDAASQPFFQLNLESDVRFSKLVIIDECSMVDERMGSDLLSFGTKILVLGDPAQLPPVKGEGFFTNAEPNIMLDEIHRQAADNPIIRMASIVRQGGSLQHGDYDESRVIRREELNAEIALGADQIIVGKNETRHSYNRRLRELQGFTGILPNKTEKLVCLRNNSELGLLNGAIWHVVTIEEQSEEDRIRMVVKDERNNELAVEAHTQHFEGTEIPWFDKKKAQEFTYGYALTCHKSQGSQWDKVLVMDESRVFRDSRHRWLYTAITRAAQSVVVAV
jgi:exodeoxyribonuclease-5